VQRARGARPLAGRQLHTPVCSAPPKSRRPRRGRAAHQLKNEERQPRSRLLESLNCQGTGGVWAGSGWGVAARGGGAAGGGEGSCRRVRQGGACGAPYLVATKAADAGLDATGAEGGEVAGGAGGGGCRRGQRGRRGGWVMRRKETSPGAGRTEPAVVSARARAGRAAASRAAKASPRARGAPGAARGSQERPEEGAGGAEVAAGRRLQVLRLHGGDDVEHGHAGHANEIFGGWGWEEATAVGTSAAGEATRVPRPLSCPRRFPSCCPC
jgi:hypothetical protein